jgi:hypothetical protein
VVRDTGDDHGLTVPLSVAFGNPDLLPAVGLGGVLDGLGAEHEYNNDEQIDNTMRSILFEIPKPGRNVWARLSTAGGINPDEHWRDK